MAAAKRSIGVSLERRGSRFALVQIDELGSIKEIPLTEAELKSLSQALPMFLQPRVARGLAGASDIVAVPTIPAHSAELNTDVHNSRVMLTIRDRRNTRFDFSLTLRLARELGSRLIARAVAAEDASRKTIKQ